MDLLGFFKLSTVVGGVQVNLCEPVKDHFSGVDLPAGVQTISGTQALSFVRQRHGLPRGDLDRIVRQQTFMAGMIRKLLSEKVLLNPGKQQDLVQAAAQSVTVDNSLDLMQLAQQMQSVTAGNINFQTVPLIGDAKDDQGRDILKLPDTETLHAFFAQLSASPAPPPAAPSGPTPDATASRTVAAAQVKVQVNNGSGSPGLAATAGSALQKAGFTLAGTGNADASTYTQSEIRYAAGDEALAATVAASLPGAKLVKRSGVTPGTVQLVLGSDFKGLSKAAGSTPAPTAPSASSPPAETPRTAADTSCIN